MKWPFFSSCCTMTPDKKDLHPLGYFSKLHGFKGELTAALNTDNIRDYESLDHVFVEIRGELIPFIVELIEFKTNTTAKVKLEGIDQESQAKNLVKCSIYIEPEQISEEDDEKLALQHMVGYAVFDKEFGPIGEIVHLEDRGPNPIMTLSFQNKEILIPIHPDFFESIDHDKHEVRLQTPEGLIEFYLNQ